MASEIESLGLKQKTRARVVKLGTSSPGVVGVASKERPRVGSVARTNGTAFLAQTVEDFPVPERLAARVAELAPERVIVWMGLPLRNDELEGEEGSYPD